LPQIKQHFNNSVGSTPKGWLLAKMIHWIIS